MHITPLRPAIGRQSGHEAPDRPWPPRRRTHDKAHIKGPYGPGTALSRLPPLAPPQPRSCHCSWTCWGRQGSRRAASGSSTAHGMMVHHQRNATATAPLAPMLDLTAAAAAARVVVAACSRPSGSRRRRIARGGSSSTITAGRAQNCTRSGTRRRRGQEVSKRWSGGV